MKPTSLNRVSLPVELKKAITDLDLNSFQKVLELFPKKQELAWITMWRYALRHADQSLLNDLEKVSSQVLGAGTELILAGQAANLEAVSWLLKRQDFKSGSPLRCARSGVNDKEYEVLTHALVKLIRDNNHSTNPVHKIISAMLEVYPPALVGQDNIHTYVQCIASAHRQGDLDSLARLLKAGKVSSGRRGNTHSQSWALSFLAEASFGEIKDLIENQKSHQEFARQWNSIFPASLSPYHTKDFITAKNSWEAILLQGGKSAYDILTKPDSPMLPETLETITTQENFNVFLVKMSSRPGDLARLLSQEKIKSTFHSWRSSSGENSLHVLLRAMPHYSFKPRWGTLSAWLDKNAAEMFKQSFANGESVNEHLAKVSPAWLSKRRRKDLMNIASVKPSNSPAPKPKI